VSNPTTITLVVDTAANATVDGVWSRLDVVPVGAATQAVFATGSGATATKGTADEYACPPFEVTCVPSRTANGTSTVLSLISGVAGQVQVRPCSC
jgi:hypothetical protein